MYLFIGYITGGWEGEVIGLRWTVRDFVLLCLAFLSAATKHCCAAGEETCQFPASVDQSWEC